MSKIAPIMGEEEYMYWKASCRYHPYSRLLIFIFMKYAIYNDTGWLLVIFLHQVYRLVRDCADITRYSYYCDYFRSLIDYIAYLPTLRDKHPIFVIDIQTCKCAILILGLLRFGLSHLYIYTRYLFFFLWNMQFRTIQGDCWL